jgi:hypothetical protein
LTTLSTFCCLTDRKAAVGILLIVGVIGGFSIDIGALIARLALGRLFFTLRGVIVFVGVEIFDGFDFDIAWGGEGVARFSEEDIVGFVTEDDTDLVFGDQETERRRGIFARARTGSIE